jgi:hypothetical protein
MEPQLHPSKGATLVFTWPSGHVNTDVLDGGSKTNTTGDSSSGGTCRWIFQCRSECKSAVVLNWSGSSGIKDGGTGAEGPVRFVCREMRNVAWCRSGGTVTSGGKHSGGGVVCIYLGPAAAVIGASLPCFSAPVEDAILAKSHVHAMAMSDIKKQLGINALGAS